MARHLQMSYCAEMQNCATTSQYAAEFQDVSLRRGDVLALQNVTLSMPRHSTTAILGTSGSGKSSLIQLIIGLLRPDSGKVQTLGENIADCELQNLRKRIGYAIQDVALFPHMKVGRNIVLPAVLHNRTGDETRKRLDELMQIMQLSPDILDRYPHELSGGQQQRAGLCRAMLLRPELLLLDEPFSGLDTMTRRAIHREFRTLRRLEPVSTIIVTHDPQEAVALAEQLVVMMAGTILQSGPTKDVMEHPANEYVQELCTGLG
ncbi:MAG: ATP-binding cassette domain-containing protein [Gammaproteobacteria bacterium]|nr:ATP-binding cassette domain-containing protein [Gammaproteobacteria bacterium]